MTWEIIFWGSEPDVKKLCAKQSWGKVRPLSSTQIGLVCEHLINKHLLNFMENIKKEMF